MQKIYDQTAMNILPVPNGFIIAACREALEKKMVVMYKLVSFEESNISPVTKSVYMYAKFGEDYKSYEMQLNQPFYWRTHTLPGGRIFAVHPNGEVRVFDKQACTEWQGTMKYKDSGPADIAVDGNSIWASFPDNNAIIRFNLRTMREELRIGGSNSAFASPEGLWINGESLMVCNSASHKLWQVNLKSYTVHEYASFDVPIHQYMKFGPYEIVRLDSGVYKL